MDYAKAVTRGRFLLKRSNEDQWELAELTYTIITQEGHGSARRWAAALGVTESYVSRLKAVWERFGKLDHDQVFSDYLTRVSVSPERERELDREARRTGRTISSVHRSRREQERAAREALLDRKQRRQLLADATIREVLERELRGPKPKPSPPRRRRDFVVELKEIRDQLNQLLVDMLDRGVAKEEKRELLAELVELQVALVRMESFVKTGSRTFEDALEAMLAGDKAAPPVERPKPARAPKPPASPAPAPVEEPAAEAPPTRERPRRRDRADQNAEGPTRPHRRDREAS